eukprot:1325-Heterococcus_DN1.PRE.1
MSEDAAFYGEFELLKWLRRSGCGWSPLLVGCNIIRSPRSSAKCLSTMKWFTQQLGVRWSQSLKEALLKHCFLRPVPLEILQSQSIF